MFRSLFQKLVLVYLIITVLLTAAASYSLSRFFAHYFLEQKQQQLIAQAAKINTLTSEYRAGRISSGELRQALEAISYATNARVYVLNVRGETMAALEARTPAGLAERDLLHDIERILQGDTVVSSRRFISTLNTPVVFVGTPLKTGETVAGAVLFLAPLTYIEEPLAAVNRVLVKSALAIVAIAVVAVFVVSRRITRPVTSMGQAAERVAAGDYSQEVVVRGSDEIAQLARSFNIMQERLRETERMRQELIADISHELRTPLTTIRGFVQAMLDGVVKPAEQPQYLSLVLDETTRLAGLVSDLLELARIQAGAVRLRIDLIDVPALLEEAADSFRLRAAEKGISLRTSVQPAVTVRADYDRLKQVILNLLSNAIRYTPPGGTVSLSATCDSSAVTFSVVDTGPGVPEEELTRIFEKFHRLDKSRDSVTGGTGLGLSIARQLVMLHGGSINAQNRAGGTGLAVSFIIPHEPTV
ncbi:MAG: ATP-binding protein [Bacillota bacterium]